MFSIAKFLEFKTLLLRQTENSRISEW